MQVRCSRRSGRRSCRSRRRTARRARGRPAVTAARRQHAAWSAAVVRAAVQAVVAGLAVLRLQHAVAAALGELAEGPAAVVAADVHGSPGRTARRRQRRPWRRRRTDRACSPGCSRCSRRGSAPSPGRRPLPCRAGRSCRRSADQSPRRCCCSDRTSRRCAVARSVGAVGRGQAPRAVIRAVHVHARAVGTGAGGAANRGRTALRRVESAHTHAAVVADLAVGDDAVAAHAHAHALGRDEAGQRQVEVGLVGVTLGVKQRHLVDVADGSPGCALALRSRASPSRALPTVAVDGAVGLSRMVRLSCECRPPRSSASLPPMNTHTSSSPEKVSTSPPLNSNQWWISVVKPKLCPLLLFSRRRRRGRGRDDLRHHPAARVEREQLLTERGVAVRAVGLLHHVDGVDVLDERRRRRRTGRSFEYHWSKFALLVLCAPP